MTPASVISYAVLRTIDAVLEEGAATIQSVYWFDCVGRGPWNPSEEYLPTTRRHKDVDLKRKEVAPL